MELHVQIVFCMVLVLNLEDGLCWGRVVPAELPAVVAIHVYSSNLIM